MTFSKEYNEGFDLWKAAERLLFDSWEKKCKKLKETLTAEDYHSDQKKRSSCDVEQPYLSPPLQVEFEEKIRSKTHRRSRR
jgi:hypothetical protein